MRRYLDNMNVSAVMQYEGRVWFFENKLQSLFELNKDTYQAILICTFKLDNSIVVKSMFSCNNKIIMCALRGSRVLIFDLCRNEYEEVNGSINLKYGDSEYFNFHAVEDNNIFFIPIHIICKDNRLYVLYLNFDVKELKEIEFKPMDRYLEDGIYDIEYPSRYGSKIYLPIKGTSDIVQIDLNEKKYYLSHFNSKILLSGICADKQGLWVSQKDSADIISLDTEGNVTKRIITNNFVQKDPYSYLHNMGEFTLALPRSGDICVCIEKESFNVYEYRVTKSREFLENSSKCVACISDSRSIMLFPLSMAGMVIIDLATMNADNVSVWVEQDEYLSIIYDQGDIYYENEVTSLNTFIRYIIGGKNGR